MTDKEIYFITLAGLDKVKEIPTYCGTAAEKAKEYISVLKNLITEEIKKLIDE